MNFEIIPFSGVHLQEAAQLAAIQYSLERRSLPVLSPRLESPIETKRVIQAILATPQKEGFAAFESGTMKAYILGYSLTDDPVWGRMGFAPLYGTACDPDVDPAIMKLLYAEIGRRWVLDEVLSHCVFLPASDQRMGQLWYSLGFGIEQVHAIADLKNRTATQHPFPPDVEIRAVTVRDSDRLARLSDVIWKVQIEAPVWAPISSNSAAEMRESWRRLPAEENLFVFGAFRNGELLGVQIYAPTEKTDRNMHLPDNCVSLVVAGTKATSRGTGINTALTEYGFSRALSNGFEYCETDWRSTNAMASSFWPSRGFKPFAYRLARRIDPRITKAKD